MYRYGKKVRDMMPHMHALTNAEKKLIEAQGILGSKRVRYTPVFLCSEDQSNNSNKIFYFKLL